MFGVVSCDDYAFDECCRLVILIFPSDNTNLTIQILTG